MKRIKILLIALILILGGAIFSNVKAANSIMLGAQETRPYSDDNIYDEYNEEGIYIYRFLKGEEGLTRGYTIFKIYEKDDTEYSRAFYCLRGRVGFGADENSDVASETIEYTYLGEMHDSANSVISQYSSLFDVNLDTTKTMESKSIEVDGRETTENKSVNIYNAILWILDNSYIPTDDEENGYIASDYKEELLNKVGIANNETVRNMITDDDIEVIQQLAIWYFTNYDQQSEAISISRTDPNIVKYLGLVTSINGEDTYDNNVFIEGNTDQERSRANSLNAIYQYFINGAMEASSSYTGTTTRKTTREEIKFNHNLNLGIESVDYGGIIYENWANQYLSEYYYEIGPFSLISSDSVNTDQRNVVQTSDIVLKDANGNIVSPYYYSEDNIKSKTYYFVDESGNVVTELQLGQKYYIRIYKSYTTSDWRFDDNDIVAEIPSSYKYDVEEVTLEISSTYSEATANFYYRTNEDQPIVEISKVYKIEGDTITTTPEKEFDLSLRKFITSINNEVLTGDDSRVPVIDTTTLINGVTNRKGETEYTATYTHSKNAITVETEYTVVYTIRIYNEGEIDGTATEITDYLPTGLELAEYTVGDGSINDTYGWTVSSDGKITTTYLANTIIKAFDASKTEAEEGWQKADTGAGGLYYADVQVECVVTAEVGTTSISLRNIAEITADTGDDRDSVPDDVDTNNYTPPSDNSTYQEDDDDYEDLVLKAKEFDLSLRKFITSINGEVLTGDDSRVPVIDTTTLINGVTNRKGETEYTATYTHSKEPITVKQGDIITYTLRVYNEGEIAGYVTEITDYIPEGLALILNYNTNYNNGWKLPEDLNASQVMDLIGEDGFYATEDDVKNLSLNDFTGITDLSEVQLVTGEVAITTNELKDKLIKAFDVDKTEEEEGWQKAEAGEGGLYYKDVQLTCLVIAENTYQDTITNIAEISGDKDENGNDVTDRDSVPGNVDTDNYTPPSDNSTYQEDDDDYEPVVLRYFDLALRKFITGIETGGTLTDVTSRIPSLSIDEETGNIVYNHSKDPVYVANNDIVIYTIRVYNEGTIAGYAEEITDDIPDGLEYLPNHEINKDYEWVMIDENGEVTENVEEAVKIITDYLSQAKEESEGRDNLINAFDSSKALSADNPDYRDVKVAFRIVEPNTSDRIIVNSAQISEDSDDDEDSVPDEWNEGEDDQDREYVYVKYFDLSLLKWVTQTIVTVDGTTTTTETGFEPNTGKTETTGIRDNDEAEPIAKVELDKSKLSKTTVKFVYKIRVTNEGEIAGYATEITDYIPEGLEFLESDNKEYGWKKDGDDKVTTRALETVLLEPGESAEVEIVFRWINGSDNLGLKTNIAEISEDYNESNSPDIDSVPDNKKEPYETEQEDDDDFALVILSLKTGKGASYTLLIVTVVGVLAVGIYLIKRYVLTY